MGILEPIFCYKVRTPSGVFGVMSLALYASAHRILTLYSPMSFPFLHKQRSRDTLPGYGRTETKAQTCSRAPFNRFLLRLSPCVNLFYCLLLFHHPMGSIPTEDTAVFGIMPRQINARTWTYRVHIEWAFLSPSSVIKSEHLRECSAS